MQDLGILEVDLRVLELDLRFRGGLGSSPIGLENFRVGLEIFWPPSGNEGVWRGKNQRGKNHEFEKYINHLFFASARPVILQRNENPRRTSPIHLVPIAYTKRTAYIVGGNSLETRFGISKQLFCL